MKCKTRFGIIAILLFLGAGLHVDTPLEAAGAVVLPGSVRSMLDAKYPGWQPSQVGADVQAFVRERSSVASANIIKGDFDGNGRTDYAVLLEYPSGPQVGAINWLQLVAFLAEKKSFKLIVLNDPIPSEPQFYITLQRKGARGYNLATYKRFRYPHDSIGMWYFGVAGGTFIYSNGRFRHVAESD